MDALVVYVLQSTAIAAAALALGGIADRDPRLAYRWWTLASVVALAGPLIFAREGWRHIETGGFVVSGEALAAMAPASLRLDARGALLAGAALLAAWRLVGLWRLRGVVGRAEALSLPPEATARLAAIESQLGVRPRYLVSREVEGPFAYGTREGAVVVPVRFLSLSAARQEAIAVHELLHLGDRDWLRLWAEEAVRCLAWFTPAVHLLLARLRTARESWIDRRAALLLGDRRCYLETLVEMAGRRKPFPAQPVSPFLERSSLKRRVRSLLEDRPMSRLHRLAAQTAVFVVLPAVAVWSGALFPAGLRAQEPQVHRVGDGVSAPRLIEKVAPVYSNEAREAGIEGTVSMSVEVHPDGRAHNIRVTRGLGSGLDEQAIAAVEQWRFEPGVKDGEAVIVKATIETNFRLLDRPQR